MAKKSSDGRESVGGGPWKGVRDLLDPLAVPPEYLRRSLNMYIPDPKGGSDIYSRPGFKRVAEIAVETSEASEAMVRAKIDWTDGFDLGRQNLDGIHTALDRYPVTIGDWIFHLTGGRDDGGYVTSVAGTDGDAGHYTIVPRPVATAGNGMVGDPSPTQGGISLAWNLFGVAPTETLWIYAFAASTLFGLAPHVVIGIHPDLTVSAYRVFGGVSAPTFTEILTSTATVPLLGWFKLEASCAISPVGNTRGGFVLVRLYTEADPAGTVIVSAINVQTNNSSFSPVIVAEAFGTCCVSGTGVGVGVSGVGVDDLTRYLGNGTVKKFLQDTFVGTSLAAAPGASSESSVSFDDTGESTFTGFVHTFGLSDRWRNVSRTTDLVAPVAEYTPICLAPAQGLYSDAGDWADGEPNYLNSNGSRYNHFSQSQKDTYGISALRANANVLIALAPAIISGVFVVPWENGFGSSGHLNTDQGIGRGPNRVFRPLVRVADVLHVFNATIAELDGGWKGQLGYGQFQREVLELPEGTARSVVEASEVGTQGDPSFIDEENFDLPENRFDVLQAALEYVYLKRQFVEIERGPLPPVAAFTHTGDAKDYAFADTSTDWDGTVVGRVWDFGDGSATSTDETPSHHFDVPGTYRVTLTVTDNDALTDSTYIDLVVPNVAPEAAFTFDQAPASLAVDFTDASTDADGTIASRAWDFGDGDTSTATNPSHTYAEAGDYVVGLIVTDDLGATSLISQQTVTVPPAASDCALSAFALADTPYVQGDDFNGGNPPLPAYGNTAAFKAIIDATGPLGTRKAYDFPNFGANVGDAEYSIDGINRFNGHPTLKLAYGAGLGGAGWLCTPSDDGDPTEVEFLPSFQWTRVRIKAESGVVSQVLDPEDDPFSGLQIISLSRLAVEADLFVRGGRVMLDVETKGSNGITTIHNTYDLGPESLLIGTAGFREAIVLYEGDNAAHTLRIRVWIGDACAMTGVSPIADHTQAAYPRSGHPAEGLTIDTVALFGCYFNPSGAAKYVTVADWETMPTSVDANPFAVALT